MSENKKYTIVYIACREGRFADYPFIRTDRVETDDLDKLIADKYPETTLTVFEGWPRLVVM